MGLGQERKEKNLFASSPSARVTSGPSLVRLQTSEARTTWCRGASPVDLFRSGGGFRTYAILPMIVFISSAENARSVSVRMLPCPPMLNASAVAAISSAASLIVTMS